MTLVPALKPIVRKSALSGKAREMPGNLTRREFIKLASLSLMGLFFVHGASAQAEETNFWGRVTDESLRLYEAPNISSKAVDLVWKDTVLPITFVTTGPDIYAFNRVWYQLGNNGFAHSGSIQPVQILLNEPVSELPPEGKLAEVSVPFTDARWSPGTKQPVAYRYYYQTTHWIIGVQLDEDGKAWYEVVDDKWDLRYFADARHLRIIPQEELAPISPGVPPESKRLEIDTAAQVVIAIENEQPVFVARIASGARFSNGDFSTPLGQHLIFHKRPARHMAAGNLAANGFDLPGVPWVSYFTEKGVAFHGTYWHNNFGHPRSHGCVNLTPSAAQWIYRWTTPVVPPSLQYEYKKFGGTVVNVR